MFSGIVQAIGTLLESREQGGDRRLLIDSGSLRLERSAIGDSIAVSGVCLTVTGLEGSRFAADISRETLAATNLGAARPGRRVNLEQPLAYGAPIGGHLVTGHVDGLARLLERRDDARSVRMRFQAPDGLARYLARKGAVCLEGVSLTVNSVDGPRFEINLVPHTLASTTLAELRPGAAVNLEIDLLARYIDRLLASQDSRPPDAVR